MSGEFTYSDSFSNPRIKMKILKNDLGSRDGYLDKLFIGNFLYS